METGKTAKYLKYSIGEIILVVIGILIALQINTWNENRKAEAQEESSMKEIIENLKYDIVRCERNSEKNILLIRGLDSLRTSVGQAIDGEDETVNIYYYALKYGADFSKAVLNKTTYKEIANSGLIKNISNKLLVQQLSDYYERISTTVPEFQPNIGHANMQNTQKKFISYIGLEGYITSLDSFNAATYSPDYDFKNIRELENLELLTPDGLGLTDYYNEITQFEIDLKTYIFYMSWTAKAAKKLIENIEKEYELAPTLL